MLYLIIAHLLSFFNFDANPKDLDLVFHWVSRFIHLTQIDLINWLITLWIINEFENPSFQHCSVAYQMVFFYQGHFVPSLTICHTFYCLLLGRTVSLLETSVYPWYLLFATLLEGVIDTLLSSYKCTQWKIIWVRNILGYEMTGYPTVGASYIKDRW